MYVPVYGKDCFSKKPLPLVVSEVWGTRSLGWEGDLLFILCSFLLLGIFLPCAYITFFTEDIS